MRNDRLIQQDVLRKLGERNVPADKIGVEVHHGVVKLAGHVNHFAVKRIAEQAAQSVERVSNVIIDIDVAGGCVAPRLVCVSAK
jgi:osmotically-inducible protein OsmY